MSPRLTPDRFGQLSGGCQPAYVVCLRVGDPVARVDVAEVAGRMPRLRVGLLHRLQGRTPRLRDREERVAGYDDVEAGRRVVPVRVGLRLRGRRGPVPQRLA